MAWGRVREEGRKQILQWVDFAMGGLTLEEGEEWRDDNHGKLWKGNVEWW